MSKTYFLSCKVEQGMFSDERVVTVDTPRGVFISIVPTAKIKKTLGKDCVAVRILKTGQESWAVIPSAQPESIPIKMEDLLSL
ncbi:MAG: hypothetical protein A3G41_08505 [Elusimicrobia bacterium RIFCSPLOWO2_12_FULL_59_9]|nr:MAG: hypothetical protein A3G41_08505 [Elusimicrobia bacterium RIFCSPLOWO2_12_FULL_59_9]